MSYVCFNFFHELFYVQCLTESGRFIKIVPSTIGDYLDAEALAYWIMCDGTKHHSCLVLSTDSFTLEKVQLLIKVLESNFGLVCTYHTINNRGKVCYRIYIRKEFYGLLNNLVLPYFIPQCFINFIFDLL